MSVAQGQVQFFGQYLLSAGFVTAAAIEDAVRYQDAVNLPLGALALSKALLSERQVLTIHTEQKRTDQPFGEIAVQRGFLTREQLDELLKEQAEARVLLGEALVQQDHLTRNKLNEALITYHASQAQAELKIKRKLGELPYPTLCKATAEITGRMLLRMARLTSKLREADRGAPPSAAWSFSMQVGGMQDFRYWLCLDEPTLLQVARGMFSMLPDEEPPGAVDDLVLDTGQEFVNIVVGHICSNLSKREGIETMPQPPERLERGAELPTDGSWTHFELLAPAGELIRVGLQLPE